jgi:para-nitrobenzyl esterase
VGKSFSWGPLADGEYYMGNPSQVGFRKETSDIPMLVGSVLGEMTNNYNQKVGEGHKNSWTEEYKYALMKEHFGDKADQIMHEFMDAYPDRNIADVLFVDQKLRISSINYSMQRAKESKAPCYNWLFNLEAPFMNGTMPWHNADVPYVFHNAEYIEAQYEPEISEKLQEIMAGAWVNFAMSGNPNHANMPNWDPVTEQSCPTMIFDRKCKCLIDHDKKLMNLLPNLSRGPVVSSKLITVSGIKV